PADGRGDSQASIVGDAFDPGPGGLVQTSAIALGAGAQCEGTALLGDSDLPVSFTLAPDSVLVISLVADLAASAGADPADYAVSSVQLQLSGIDGDSNQNSSANAMVVAGGGFGNDDTLHELLTVSFVNAGDTTLTGTFFGGVDSTAIETSAVPEPASAAMLVAGLAALGLARRRRAAPRLRA
ncbi:MAG TPA: PEP-CTERM sorting domain-containing protein, partial [Burkholderiaceae bacterium]